MTTSYPARAEEAKLVEIANNPGILPFKMGFCKITQTYHAFLHFIDLDFIKDQIKVIESQVFTLDALISDLSKDYKFRFTTLQEYISDTLRLILDKYNSLSRTRFRRALIDGLGTIIHSITGNLDQNDALRYNKAIDTLQKNQNEITRHVNQAVSLNKLFLENFNSTISSVVQNQDKLSLKISEIIRNTNMSEQKFIDYIKLDSSYKLLEINIQTILCTLTNLETAISLSEKNIAYRNLITFSNIEYFIQELRKHYDPDQLITFDVKGSRLFYKFLDVGSYFSDNKLVFVVRVPIYYKDIYTYYQLFPLPTSNDTILIPNQSHLVMNENAYQYLDTPCNKIENFYYCKNTILLRDSKRDPDCIYTLITSQELSSQCQYQRITIAQEIFEKINDEYYIYVSLNTTKLRIQCAQEEYLQVKGIYLLKLPENCSASNGKLKFMNMHNVIYGIPIKLLAINLEEATIKNPLQQLKIDNVNLKQLHNTIGFLEREQRPVDLEDINLQPHLFWTSPLYILLALVGLYALYGRWKKYKAARMSGTAQRIERLEQCATEAVPRSLIS